jgi:hypothetical protein
MPEYYTHPEIARFLDSLDAVFTPILIMGEYLTWDLERGAENSFGVSLRRSTYFEIALL